MQVVIDLPNDFVAFQSMADLKQEVSSSYALWLYQRGRVTLAKAAELAGISLYDFMGLCKSNLIPVIDITRDELLDEIAGFSQS